MICASAAYEFLTANNIEDDEGTGAPNIGKVALAFGVNIPALTGQWRKFRQNLSHGEVE